MKRGKKRAQLQVSSCFAPLMRWVVSLLPGDRQQLALALDATNIKDNFTVLSINVLIAGCAIPVAWCIVKATVPGSWKPLWQELLTHLQGVIPTHWTVIVCAERGLYADWLYEMIVSVGWHPFLRINHQGTYRTLQSSNWRPLSEVVRQPGQSCSGDVICFKTNPLECSLLARWDIEYSDPWLILTDLEPASASA